MQIPEQVRAFIKEHLSDDVRKLILQKDKFPEVDIHFVARQIEGRRKAMEKFPRLAKNEAFIYPSKEAMEQCSSEYTAQYKASLVQDATVADITGGLGIDSLYLSESNMRVVHIERNPELQEIAAHNFSALQRNNIQSHCSDAIAFLENTDMFFDLVFIDPARRDSSKNKVFLFSDCEPDVTKLRKLLFSKTKRVLIKASPFLDISKAVAELGNISHVHIVAVKNECKELLFECVPESTPLQQIHCVNILSDGSSKKFTFSPDEERESVVQYSDKLLSYLYEPNVTIIKSGAFKLFGQQYHLEKLHPNSHLYTSMNLVEHIPAKRFLVEAVFPFDKKGIQQYIPEKKANLVIRNFPSSVDEAKKKFHIEDGGEIYVYLTTLQNGQKIAIRAKKID